MRVNVYTEELLRGGEGSPPVAEVVTAEYVSSRTGLSMRNYGLRIYLASSHELHYVPGRDDDRSAVTIWCGDSASNVLKFWDQIRRCVELDNLDRFRARVAAAETAEASRSSG